LFSSTDGGQTWDSLKYANWLAGVTQLDSMLFIVSIEGYVKRSFDGGVTWADDPGFYRDYYGSLTVDSSNRVFLGNATGLFVEGPPLENSILPPWKQLTSWNTSTGYTAPSGMKIFGGNYGDVLHSTDPDSLWQLVNINAPGAAVQSITSLGDWVFIAPKNYGVYRCKLTGLQKQKSNVPPTHTASLNESVLLYPNPASDECTLQINSSSLAPILCELYSVDGRKIRSWKIDLIGSRDIQNTFSTHELLKGVYYVHVSNSAWGTAVKFIKM
jgi:hypothetical protein